MIIIHSYFPPSFESSRYAKLAGVSCEGRVSGNRAISSLKFDLGLTVVRCLKDSGMISIDP